MPGTSAPTYGQPTTSHAHPASRPDTLSQSPKKEPETTFNGRGNGAGFSSHSPMMREPRPPSPKESVRVSDFLLSPSVQLIDNNRQKPARAADPMSFASILSEPAGDPSPRRPSPPPPPAPVNNHKEPEPAPVAGLPRLEKKPSIEKRRRTLDPPPALDNAPPQQPFANGTMEPGKPPIQPRVVKPRRTLTERDLETINRLVAEIDKAEKSDVEEPGFEQEWERYIMKGRKRALDAERLEAKRRKVCRGVLSLSPVSI